MRGKDQQMPKITSSGASNVAAQPGEPGGAALGPEAAPEAAPALEPAPEPAPLTPAEIAQRRAAAQVRAQAAKAAAPPPQDIIASGSIALPPLGGSGG